MVPGALPKEISIFNILERNLNFTLFFQLLFTVCYCTHLASKLGLKSEISLRRKYICFDPNNKCTCQTFINIEIQVCIKEGTEHLLPHDEFSGSIPLGKGLRVYLNVALNLRYT